MSITIVTGPPGAGKTTVATAVAKSGPLGVHLVADQCFHWIVSGYLAPWLRDADDQNITVMEAVGAATARYAEGGYDVVVDGIVGPQFLRRFQRAIGPTADALRYVVLRPRREIAFQRAVGRAGPQDLVDPDAVGAMYDRFLDLGPFESHVIDSSTHDPRVTVQAVRRGLDHGLFVVAATGTSS